MLESLIWRTEFIFYILAAEMFIFCILQMRTNRLIRKSMKNREQKKEKIKKLKEEIKNGESEIPVVKFEEPEREKKAKKREEETKEPEKQHGFDPKEVAVLQDMLAEYFG